MLKERILNWRRLAAQRKRTAAAAKPLGRQTRRKLVASKFHGMVEGLHQWSSKTGRLPDAKRGSGSSREAQLAALVATSALTLEAYPQATKKLLTQVLGVDATWR